MTSNVFWAKLKMISGPGELGAGVGLLGIRKDGTEFPVETRTSPIRTAGEVLVSNTIGDVNMSKKADHKRFALLETAVRDVVASKLAENNGKTGTCFSIILPATQTDAAASSEPRLLAAS